MKCRFKNSDDEVSTVYKENRKNEDEFIGSPLTGNVINLAQVNDPLFSSKAMGEGVGIIPESNTIKAPISEKNRKPVSDRSRLRYPFRKWYGNLSAYWY